MNGVPRSAYSSRTAARARSVPEAARGARLVVVGEEPRRPRRAIGERLEVVDRRAERVRVPRQLDEDEVVREMQLVAGGEVADDAMQVLQRDLADDHPVVVLVDHAADPAQALVDRVPVLVVPAGRADVVAQERVLRDLVDRVEPQAVDAAVHPEADHVVHRGLDLGVVPVEVGLLGHERVQVPLARGRVERPRRADGAELRRPVVGRAAVRRAVAPHVPVALRRCRGSRATPRTTGAGRTCGSGPSRSPRGCRARGRSRPARRSPPACRRRDRRRSSRTRRSRSRPSASGRTATARSPRRRARRGGRRARRCPRRSPIPSPSESANERG